MITNDSIREAVFDGILTVTSQRMMFGDADRFEDEGLDSLDRMSLMLEVEERLGLDFDGLDPKDVESISDYFELVHSHSNQQEEVVV